MKTILACAVCTLALCCLVPANVKAVEYIYCPQQQDGELEEDWYVQDFTDAYIWSPPMMPQLPESTEEVSPTGGASGRGDGTSTATQINQWTGNGQPESSTIVR
jgi:hypothetical protein